MAFTFKLANLDGPPGDPPRIRSAVPNWEMGDTTRAARAGRRCWSAGSAIHANLSITLFSS
jgi:hypothetical protein